MNAINLDRLRALASATGQAGAALAMHRDRFATLANRHENGTAPRAVVAYQLFQTPPAIAARMAELLELQPGERVLEPSAGLGRLISAVQAYNPGEVYAVDCAPACCQELARMFPRVPVRQGDFLQMLPREEFRDFDAIIMNPPFHVRADIRHIEHAFRFLRPGGRLVGLCMAGPARLQRFKEIADHWEELPAETFKSEGTRVETYLFRIRE